MKKCNRVFSIGVLTKDSDSAFLKATIGFALLLLVLVFSPQIVGATIFQPGETLTPDCAPETPDCGVAVMSLNAQSGVQTLAVGSAGTDFSISSLNNVHTFNIPSSSVTARGLLSALDWSAFNNKEVPLTFSSGLSRVANDVANNLITGVAGGQTIIGGTAVGDGLIYKSTTGAGTATGRAHQFVGGTNGGTVAMTLLNNGNVGVGMTTPDVNLHIYQNNPTADQVLFKVGTSGDSSRFTIDENGEVITDGSYSISGYGGLTPSDFTGRLKVITEGGQYWIDMGGNNTFRIGQSGGAARTYVTFTGTQTTFSNSVSSSWQVTDTAGNAALYVKNDGNVGVGTADPTSKLEVVGSASFSSTVSGATSYNGLVITPNTGVITTGTWNGTTIAVNRGGTGTTNGSITGTGALSFTSNGINALTLDSGTTGNINIGINSNSKNIFIGNTVGTTAVQLNAGSGGIFINGVGAATAGNVVVCIDANNQLFFGATEATCNPSSARYKHDIADLALGLDAVNALHPVSFVYNSNNEATLGFIAEEAAQVDERLVKRDTNGIIQAVNPNAFTPILTHAIQQVAVLVGDISPKVNADGSDNDLSAFLSDLQAENAHNPVSIITAKIAEGKQFLVDFITARVTAVRGYFDEIFAKKIHTEQICVKKSDGSEVCINGDELYVLLQNTNIPSTPDVLPTLESAPEPAPEPEPEFEFESEFEPAPNETPAEILPTTEAEIVNPVIEPVPVSVDEIILPEAIPSPEEQSVEEITPEMSP